MKVERYCVVNDPINKGKYTAVYQCPYDDCDSLTVEKDIIEQSKKDYPDKEICSICPKCKRQITY